VRLADRLEQARGRGLLEQVAGGAVADRLEDLVLPVEDREHQDHRGRMQLEDPRHALGAEHPGQVDVEQHDVGTVAQPGERLLDRAEAPRAPHVRLAGDQLAEALADRRVILHDRHLDRHQGIISDALGVRQRMIMPPGRAARCGCRRRAPRRP
jgi:hypothetical protein